MKRRTIETHKSDINYLMSQVIAMINNELYDCDSAYNLYRYCQGWPVWVKLSTGHAIEIGEKPDEDGWVSFDSVIEAENCRENE